MKKTVLILLSFIITGLAMAQPAPTFEEGFEGDEMPTGWTIIDNGTNPGTWVLDTYTPHTGDKHVAVDTYDSDGGPADDWIITPQITIAEGDVLSFWAKSNKADFPDDISVYISKSDATVAAFTITVDEITEVPADYTQYRYDLTTIEGISAGDQIYIGFHCASNGSWMNMDDVRVGLPSQNYFEDFEGEIPDTWTIHDGGGDIGTWICAAERGIEETSAAYIDTYEEDYDAPDDWLISPKIKVRDDDILTFWGRCNEDYPDKISIMVSKTGTEIADFTTAIQSDMELTGTYTKYTYKFNDIAEISAGDEIHIGFHITTLGSRAMIDNFRVGFYVPPRFVYAYTVSETAIDVMFDAPISSVDAANFVLSGSADITFSDAQVDAEDSKLVHLTGASEAFAADNTLDVLTNTAEADETELYAGILPFTYTSLTNPDGTIDEGYNASFQGIIMAKNIADEGDRVWLSDGTGAHHGINAYGDDFYANCGNVGDEIILYGKVSPYKNQTEIFPAYFIETVSTGNELYEATIISGSDIAWNTTADSDPAEQYEGTMVMIENATVDSWDGAYFKCTDDGGTTKFYVGNQLGLFDGTFDENVMTEDNTYNIVGFLANYNGEYAVNPRSADDLADITGIEDMKTDMGISMYPNPVRNRLQIRTNAEMQTIIITNVAGQEVMQLQNVMSKGMEISTSQLEKGVYFATIFDVDNNKQTLKFVKQ